MSISVVDLDNRDCFILTPTKTYFCTFTGCFYLSPVQPAAHHRIIAIKALIEMGRIQCFNDLVGYCGNSVRLEYTGFSKHQLVERWM